MNILGLVLLSSTTDAYSLSDFAINFKLQTMENATQNFYISTYFENLFCFLNK